MYNLFHFIFCAALLLILHTYLLYPLCMMFLFPKAKTKVAEFSLEDKVPEVAVLIAAYNEEKVIKEKILSVFKTTYPLEKIKVYVGSDASTDKTEEIVENLKNEFQNLQLIKFQGRTGKIGIVNHLQTLGEHDILIMTDANVIFKPQTIFELVKNFKDERVGIVAGNIIKESLTNEGIAFQEKKYLSIENRIKSGESNAFNLVMGAEGGCYAIRNNLFSQVPGNFIVDDFFLTLQVLKQNKFVLFNQKAECLEDVPSSTSGEYKRKVRISSGNFQNLFFFKTFLFQFFKPVGFAFWSHKVLRWFTPFLLILCFLSSLCLLIFGGNFFWIFLIQLIGFLFPALDYLFKFKSSALKFISHFYLMNFALLEGFIKFTQGIKSNVWQPVKRNV
ncbi:MAG: glycosyltransferase [Bacteroidetes bacterium]|nr:glycosyltransferase [Bacteroidota bacterium]